MVDNDVNLVDIDKVLQVYFNTSRKELGITGNDEVQEFIMMYANNMLARINAYAKDLSTIAALSNVCNHIGYAEIKTNSTLHDIQHNIRTAYTKIQDRMLKGGDCSID